MSVNRSRGSVDYEQALFFRYVFEQGEDEKNYCRNLSLAP